MLATPDAGHMGRAARLTLLESCPATLLSGQPSSIGEHRPLAVPQLPWKRPSQTGTAVCPPEWPPSYFPEQGSLRLPLVLCGDVLAGLEVQGQENIQVHFPLVHPRGQQRGSPGNAALLLHSPDAAAQGRAPQAPRPPPGRSRSGVQSDPGALGKGVVLGTRRGPAVLKGLADVAKARGARAAGRKGTARPRLGEEKRRGPAQTRVPVRSNPSRFPFSERVLIESPVAAHNEAIVDVIRNLLVPH